jgi:hypothetical protein
MIIKDGVVSIPILSWSHCDLNECPFNAFLHAKHIAVADTIGYFQPPTPHSSSSRRAVSKLSPDIRLSADLSLNERFACSPWRVIDKSHWSNQRRVGLIAFTSTRHESYITRKNIRVVITR